MQEKNYAKRDPLQYLTKGQIARYDKGEVICDLPGASPTRLWLVLTGRVLATCADAHGKSVLLQVVEQDGFFGHTGLWSEPEVTERMVAARQTEVMSWTAEEVEAQVQHEPNLGLALIEEMCSRCSVLRDRIFALAVLPTRPRLVVSLMHLGETIGEEKDNRTVRVTGFSHQLLADYIGTSREIITTELNRLRQRGAIEYKRTYIDLSKDALAEELRATGQESLSRFNGTLTRQTAQ